MALDIDLPLVAENLVPSGLEWHKASDRRTKRANFTLNS